MGRHHFLRVCVLGVGDQAERWSALVRDRAELCEWPHRLPGEVDALVLAQNATDAVSRAKEALVAGIPVLYAAPFLLSPWQAAALAELGRSQGRLLRYAEHLQDRRGMPFLERMVGGEEPFWRPLYLRSFRALGPTASVRVDEVAIEELAVCDSLLAGDPQCVTTVASRCPKSGEVRALFLTVEYGDGRVAQCTVSVAEAANARRLVVAMQDRTVILDDQDRASPVRILGEGEQDLLGERASALDGPAADSVAAEMESFLAAVAAGDLSASNGARWTRVAGLWWAARQSMSFGGPVEVLKGPIRPVRREPPPLRVIEGGGKKTQVAKERPPLTLVAG